MLNLPYDPRDGLLIGIGFAAGLIIALMVWLDARLARRIQSPSRWIDEAGRAMADGLAESSIGHKHVPPPPAPSPHLRNGGNR